MTYDFKGKLVVVIGATSPGGMGEAIAIDLSQLGARVVVSGRNLSKAQELAEKIGGFAHRCDLSNEDEIKNLMKASANKSGRGIDIVVNAAGFAITVPLRDITGDDLRRSVDGNLVGPILAMREAANWMRPGGVFLQFTSISAQQPTMITTAYAVCKAGLEHALKIASIEYAGSSIQFLGIAPGVVFTPLTSVLNSDTSRRALESVTPLGRVVTIQDVVNTARFLVSGNCYETGHTYPVTGGAMLTRSLLPHEFGVCSA